MRDTPYRETLFLDTDTFICGPVDAIFESLACHDIVAAREFSGASLMAEVDAPDSFPELNLGVLAYRRSSEIEDLIDTAVQWSEDWYARSGSYPTDQPGLRHALFRSPLRLAMLTPEYNCRFAGYGEVSAPVRILHGRIPGQVAERRALEHVSQRINADTGPRVFVAGRLIALDRSMQSRIGTNRDRELLRIYSARKVIAVHLLKGLLRAARRALWRR